MKLGGSFVREGISGEVNPRPQHQPAALSDRGRFLLVGDTDMTGITDQRHRLVRAQMFGGGAEGAAHLGHRFTIENCRDREIHCPLPLVRHFLPKPLNCNPNDHRLIAVI